MRRGFTIVELIIVITVLGILTTMAVFGASAMMERSRNDEAESKVATLRAALEKYYSENNEYPSAASLAGGGDGRNLSSTQYNTIAATLKVPVDVLRNGTYKFVPCAVSGSLCCTMNGSNECQLPAGDGSSRYLMYMTRTATQATSGARLTYKAPAGTSGCTYYFTESMTPKENGYGAYFLMYRNYTDTDWWTTWRVYVSNEGKSWRGDWCAVAG
jgi:prepilin-type N-terminal cleavage/methylation domain-containing protein